MTTTISTTDTFDMFANQISEKIRANKRMKFKTLMEHPDFLRLVTQRYVEKTDTMANMAYQIGCNDMTLGKALKQHYRIMTMADLPTAYKKNEVVACISEELTVNDDLHNVPEMSDTDADNQNEIMPIPEPVTESKPPVSRRKSKKGAMVIDAHVLKEITRQYKSGDRSFAAIVRETPYNVNTLYTKVLEYNGVTNLAQLRRKKLIGSIEQISQDVDFIKNAALRYYNGERLEDIAKERGVSYGILRYAMMENGILLRDLRNPNNHPTWKNIKRNTNKYINDQKWLDYNYVVKKCSIAELCKMSGCSRQLVKDALVKFGIRERTPFEESLARNERIYYKRIKEIYERFCYPYKNNFAAPRREDAISETREYGVVSERRNRTVCPDCKNPKREKNHEV